MLFWVYIFIITIFALGWCLLNKRLQFILGIIVFIALLIISKWLFQTRGIPIKNWSVEHGGIVEELSIPINKVIPQPNLYKFSAIIPDPQKDSLIIPRANGYAISVWLNGTNIKQIGDMSNPTANIWNYSHLIQFDRNLLKDSNKLVIELYGLHDVGLTMSPYFQDYNNISFIVDLQNYFNNGFSYVMIGASLTLILLMMLLSFISNKSWKAYLWLSLANISYVIYNFEYIFRYSSGTLSQFLWIRKILMIFMWLSMLFFMLGLKAQSNSKRIPGIFHLLFFVVTILYIFAPNFYYLKIIVDYSNLFIIVVFIYILWLEAINPYSHLYFADTFLSIIILHTILTTILRTTDCYLLNYGVFVILVGISLNLVKQMINIEKEKDQLMDKLTVDELTNVHNRVFLHTLNLTNKDCLVFIDIDKFKQTNDRLGHQKGDQVLAQVASTLKKYVREGGEVIRYGGDEFIVIYRNTSVKTASINIKNASKALNKMVDPIENTYGISEYTESLQQTIIMADTKMYDMKRLKANKL